MFCVAKIKKIIKKFEISRKCKKNGRDAVATSGWCLYVVLGVESSLSKNAFLYIFANIPVIVRDIEKMLSEKYYVMYIVK